MARLSRRSLLARSASAGLVLGTAGWLTACAAGSSSAHRTATSGAIDLTYAPWGQWRNAGAHWQNFVKQGLAHFEQANRGIRVRVVAPGGGGGFAPSIVAGSAPDVFEDWVMPPYLSQKLVLNLEPYLKRDNLPLSLWSPGQMHAMATESGVWFLPCYIHVDTMIINLTDLDNLGISYPDPTWTYVEAESLYRRATWDKGGNHHFGVALNDMGGRMLGTAGSDTRAYALEIFGGSVMDASRTVCTIDDPRVVRAVTWFDQLYWDKVAGGSNIATNCTFAEFGSNSLVTAFTQYRSQFKWTFFPIPRYPAGRKCFEATDYHAINATTKHPDEAWTLLRFLSAEPYWSRYCMRSLMRTPSLISLWPEYVSVVESVAPQARSVQLQWYVSAAQHWGVAGRTFKYEHPQAVQIINDALGAAIDRKEGVNIALRSAAQQVNAIEKDAPALAAAKAKQTARAHRLYPTHGPAIAPVSPGL